MFNKKICEMKGKKVIHYVGNGGTVQIASWKCNFSIYLDVQVYYLDIQAITTLLCLLLILCVCLLLPQFSTYRHLTWFTVKRKQVCITNYLGLPVNWFFFKVAYFAQKKCAFQKIPKNLLFFFFSKRDNWAYVYMY